MANYGRGWNDGYGAQSAESIERHVEQDHAEYYRARAHAAARLAGRSGLRASMPSDDISAVEQFDGPIVAGAISEGKDK